MSLSKDENDSFIKDVFEKYKLALRQHPIVTKSCTSAVMAGFGNVIAQTAAGQSFKWQSVFAYSASALIYVGPTMHYFYTWLEKNVPHGSPGFAVKRILLDRFIMAPPWLLVYFYLLSRLEGLNHFRSLEKIVQTFWPILKTNWKVWTIFQYVNVNYVPKEYRVLFASCLAFFWNIYVAFARRT